MAFFNIHFTPFLLLSFIAIAAATIPEITYTFTTTTTDSIATPPSLSPSASPSFSDSPSASPSSSISDSPLASPSPSPSFPSEADLIFPTFEEPSIPADEQAKDAQFLETHMAKASDKLTTFVGSVMMQRLDDPSISPKTKECLTVCTEVYENAADALKKGLEDVNASDFLKANIDISAFASNIDTCEECLVRVNDPELLKFKTWVKGVGNDCLDKIAKYSTTINNFD